VVEEIAGEEPQGVTGLRLKNVKTGEGSVLQVDGVFIFVGYAPNTQLFKGKLRLDEQGYIACDERMRTSIPGVFGAGDVQDPLYHQITTALGSATIAAIEADRFLAELEERGYPG
jgi:thioredoxin reductase (NADPH)